MGISPPDAAGPSGERRRRLRAVFAADVANFGGLVSVDETNTLDALWTTRRIAQEELAQHSGWLFGMPGDGIFALFESAVDAVRCALSTQTRLAGMPSLNTMRLRIGVHLGEVLFHDNVPFGEALVIAARLESLADPGGILVSTAVMEAVAPRISAAFRERGVLSLKHSPRRVEAFSVWIPPSTSDPDEIPSPEALDGTVLSVLPEPAEGRVEPPPVVGPDLPETPITSLPKASPLVVPRASDDRSTPDPGQAPRAGRPSVSGTADPADLQTCYAELAQRLTTYLGPVAGVLVRMHAAKCADPFELIDLLASEIPVKAERTQFLTRAYHVVARQRG
jgi:class 3 adenylate cyclase